MLFIAFICLLLPLSILPHPYESHEPQHVDVDHYHYVTNEVLVRPKRGSFDFVGAIKNTITAHIGKASASSAAGASSGSSSGSSKHVAIEKPVITIEKDVGFDGWALKKSILNTLFQAVKAIAGGVTAINGQIIKGGGHLLSHGGQLIAKSGDAVTNVGKNIALSAKLLPAEKPVGVYKYFGSSSHSGPIEEFATLEGHEIVDELGPHELPVYAPPLPPDTYLPAAPYPAPAGPYLPPTPADLPPFQGHTQYGPPQYQHNSNYLDRKAEALSYDDRVDPAPLTGTQTLDSTPQKRAIEALQTLLRKLPNRQTTQDNYINDIDDVDIHGHENDLKSPPKPYDIPNDPVRIPAFKPIHKTPAITTTYTVQLGPIETVTKHTIGGGGDVSMAATPNHSKFTIVQNPHPNYTIQTSVQHSKRPPGNSPNRNHKNNGPRSETAVNQPPLNLYHTMTLRNGHEQHHRHHHPPHHPQQSQPSTLLHVPGEKQPYNAHNIDIQKSIEYRIQ